MATSTGCGWTRLPDGSVVVALCVPRPGGEGRLRFLVRAANRPRALTRLRNLGLRGVYLRGNTRPPTPDEITAVLHHPDGLVWRSVEDDDGPGAWRPAGALLRPPTPRRAPEAPEAPGPVEAAPEPPELPEVLEGSGRAERAD